MLEPNELAVLQQGIAVPGGNAAVIAAGTGLGEAMLHNVDGRFVPFASEGGHADFAARTPRELELVAELTRVFGRVGVELVISGPGLVNIYQFTHQAFGTGPTITPNSIAPARLCAGVGTNRRDSDLAGRIYESAREGRCPHCVEAFDMFVVGLRVRSREPGAARLRDCRRLHRRRHRAQDPAGARIRALPRGVPRQGTDGGSRRHDSGVGHPQSRRRPPRRRRACGRDDRG